jgi:putative membrane protein
MATKQVRISEQTSVAADQVNVCQVAAASSSAPVAAPSAAAPAATAAAVAANQSLADRLAASADTRHGAIRATRNSRNVRVYKTDEWFSLIFAVRNRGLTYLWQPMLLVTICAVGFTPVATLYLSEEACTSLQDASSALPFVLTALSFQLVFRLNRAAVRHYEARQLCGWMMIHTRDVALAANATLSRDHPQARDRLCEIAVAFPVAFMLHLWGDHPSREAAFTRMVDGIFEDPSTLALVKAAKHRPLCLIECAQRVLFDALGPNSAATNNGPLEQCVLTRLLDSVQGLGVPLGGCERIQGTPLPFVYVAHLRSFLITVLCAVPFVYGCEWKWATIPLSLLVAFGLLGIEAASIECERPFSPSPTKNHHDLERFAVLLSTEVMHMLQRSESHYNGGAGTVTTQAPQAHAAGVPLARAATLYGLR